MSLEQPDHTLEIENLFVPRSGREVIRGLSATAASGDVVAVTGPNGVGKTTLLRTIDGLESPSAGRLALNGRAVQPDSEAWRNRVSYCPDDGLLIDELTVVEHLRLAALLFGADAKEASSRARLLVRFLGLSAYEEYRGVQLSFGLGRRLSIGVAVARDASLYLFDEPFTGLDADGVVLLIRLLRSLGGAGRTVLSAGHAGFYLAGTATRVWHLQEDGGVHTAAGPAAAAFLAAPHPAAAEGGYVELPWLS